MLVYIIGIERNIVM